jgi:glutamine amidotransferase
MICILNYGSGNLRSIQRSIELFYPNVIITKNISKIQKAKALVLPGVGAFGDAVRELKLKNLFEPLIEIIPKKLTLGICLGMQLMFSRSSESPDYNGLNLVKGEVKQIESQFDSIKVPHTGWNRLIPVKEPKFYGYVHFNHRFFCRPADDEIIISNVLHGEFIPSIIKKGSFLGTQFHPEKSGKIGLIIIDWFVNQIEEELR